MNTVQLLILAIEEPKQVVKTVLKPTKQNKKKPTPPQKKPNKHKNIHVVFRLSNICLEYFHKFNFYHAEVLKWTCSALEFGRIHCQFEECQVETNLDLVKQQCNGGLLDCMDMQIGLPPYWWHTLIHCRWHFKFNLIFHFWVYLWVCSFSLSCVLETASTKQHSFIEQKAGITSEIRILNRNLSICKHVILFQTGRKMGDA